jgi:lipoate-protein ligase A
MTQADREVVWTSRKISGNAVRIRKRQCANKAINWLDAEDTFFDFMENSLNFK